MIVRLDFHVPRFQHGASMRTTSRRHRHRGFTILELLIVIGILLAIGSLVLVNLLGASEKADVGLTRVQLKIFESELEKFRVDMKRWPAEEEGLAVLWSKDAISTDEDKEKYGGPYLREPAPKDTWGNEWIFHAPSTIVEGANFDIISIGPDKQEGTEDDLSNHDSRKESADGEFSDFSGSSSSGSAPSN
ncbi:MAG: type II secretion system protein GspG [Planctomycetota bacterium]|nr:MAG: type II secretion system protein GspG [Planctomycetota bacterium]